MTLTDSAGFWLLLFCGFGLCLLLAMGQKINQRLERNAAQAKFRAEQFRPAQDDLKSSPNTTGPMQEELPEEVGPQKVSSMKHLIFVIGVLGAGCLLGLILLTKDMKNWLRPVSNN